MIKIIETGKIPKEYQTLIDDFIKKTGPYEKVQIVSLKEIKLKKDESNLSEKLRDETQKAIEAASGRIIFLDANGKIPIPKNLKMKY